MKEIAMRNLTAALIVACLAGTAPAGAAVLSTAFGGGNGANGEVFQIQALTNITVNDFGVNAVNGVLDAGNISTWTLYQHDGLLSSPTAGSAIWTMIASGGAVTSAGANAITDLNAGLNIGIAAGTTEAFLLLETPFLLAYSDGGGVGTVMAANSDFQILQGWGESTAFATFDPRQANISVVYTTAAPEPGMAGLLGLACAAVAVARRARPRRYGTT